MLVAFATGCQPIGLPPLHLNSVDALSELDGLTQADNLELRRRAQVDRDIRAGHRSSVAQ